MNYFFELKNGKFNTFWGELSFRDLLIKINQDWVKDDQNVDFTILIKVHSNNNWLYELTPVLQWERMNIDDNQLLNLVEPYYWKWLFSSDSIQAKDADGIYIYKLF